MIAVPREDNRIPGLAAKSTADNTVVVIEADPTTKRILVNAITATGSLVEVEGHGAVGNGTTTVSTAGTAVQIASNSCKRMWISARQDNTDVVAIGGSGVIATLTTRQGRAFFPTQGDWFSVSNTNLLFVDAAISGDIIHWYFEN